MAISRTKFDPELPFVVGVPFKFQTKDFKTGEDFPSKGVTAGVRQLRSLYNSRRLQVKKGSEVDTPAMKRAKRKAPKKAAPKKATVKKEAKKEDPEKENPWS